MKILNPFQIYSWKIRSLLILVLAIQLSMWGSIILDLMGLQIPLLRQLTGTIYLLFIPGILIFRLLELNKVSNIESILYIIGLSITFLMFTGLFINYFYSNLGIIKPISILPLIVTISSVILLLCILCYFKEQNCYSYSYIDTKEFFSSRLLFLLLIPFLAIYGAFLVNFYHNNSLIVIFIIFIAILTFSFGFIDLIPENLYPFAIFAISLSLLLHNSLISNYLWGCDIHSEYYLSKLVVNNSYWNLHFGDIANSMLSIVMLAPIISDTCNIDLIWVFKLIYPLIFSLLPLGLYKIFEKQTTKDIAFLSCLYFVLGFEFYTEMLALARQQIAEFFFLLLILPIFNPLINNSKKAILSTIFLFSLIVSHYGFSYIFMLSLLLSLIIFKLVKLINNKSPNFILYDKLNSKQITVEKITDTNFIFLTFVLAISWYIYTSNGSIFIKVVQIGNFIANQIFIDFFKTQGQQILATSAASPMRDITKYLYVISIFFITLGIFSLYIKRIRMKFNNTYILLSIAYFIVCAIAFIVPHFASQLNTSRLFQMCLLVLAPFFPIGGISFFNIIIYQKLDVPWTNRSIKQILKLLSIFLSVFFLFNSGLIYELRDEESSSVSLNSTHYPFIYNDGEISAASWISFNKNEVNIIHADIGSANLLKGFTTDFTEFTFFNKNFSLPNNSYIFFAGLNNRYHQIYVNNGLGRLEYINETYLTESNKINYIYCNGHGKVGFV